MCRCPEYSPVYRALGTHHGTRDWHYWEPVIPCVYFVVLKVRSGQTPCSAVVILTPLAKASPWSHGTPVDVLLETRLKSVCRLYYILHHVPGMKRGMCWLRPACRSSLAQGVFPTRQAQVSTVCIPDIHGYGSLIIHGYMVASCRTDHRSQLS